VTGFPPGILLGGSAIHSANTLSAAGMSALETAHADTAGRTMCAAHAASHVFSGDLGGMTLTPGVYRWVAPPWVAFAAWTFDGPRAYFILVPLEELWS
jgi:hypothetical protein